ncbi:MAG: TPM domain-containing protein, partial [Rhodanobacteraceae bacterium]
MTSRVRILLGLLVLLDAVLIASHFAAKDETSASAVSSVAAARNDGADAIAGMPEPDYPRISDEAQILAPFAGKLSKMTDAFADDLGVDVHVATRLDANETIEAESTRLFEDRKIGAAAPTGGILILLNPAQASARIEVGYSLEGSLTDLEMGRLARDQLAPYASHGAAGMAVMDVLHYLRDQVYLSAAMDELKLGDELRRKPAYLEYQNFVSGGAGAKTDLGKLARDTDVKRAIPANERARYAPQADVAGSVDAFLRVSADLVGDPTLELLTEGSRLMRANYPYAPFEELQRLHTLRGSQPFEIREDGDYAVATSTHAAKGFVPVLLHREEGLWRVDLVETWKNLFFNSEGNYFLRNSGTPYAFGLKEFGQGADYNIAPLNLEGRSIAESLQALEGKHDVMSALRRGDIWFRNVFVFPKAYQAYEEARKLAPADPLVLEIIANRAGYLQLPELQIPALERVGR